MKIYCRRNEGSCRAGIGISAAFAFTLLKFLSAPAYKWAGMYSELWWSNFPPGQTFFPISIMVSLILSKTYFEKSDWLIWAPVANWRFSKRNHKIRVAKSSLEANFHPNIHPSLIHPSSKMSPKSHPSLTQNVTQVSPKYHPSIIQVSLLYE